MAQTATATAVNGGSGLADGSGLLDKSFKETNMVKLGKDEEGNKMVNEYSMIRTLGSGSYGKVKLAMDSNNKAYAIKIMNKSLLKRVQKNEDVRKEVAILKKMKHPNVVRLYEVIDDPDNDKMFLVMEYVQNGPVLKLESMRAKVTFSEAKSRKYMIDILNGLEYLHSMRVLHRDIKPENLLLDGNGNIKLSDFGVSHMFEGDDDTLKVTAGTPAFLSPEACTGENFSGRMADIWAVGITLYVFIFGYPPFNGESYLEIYRSIREDELKFPEPKVNEVSPELINLLKRLLDKDPKTRIRLQDIKNHPWITQKGTIEEHELSEKKHECESYSDEDSDPVPVTDSDMQNAIVEGSTKKAVDQFVLLVKMREKARKMATDARLKVASRTEKEPVEDDSAMEKTENMSALVTSDDEFNDGGVNIISHTPNVFREEEGVETTETNL